MQNEPLAFNDHMAMKVIGNLYASGEDPNTQQLDKIDISILVYLITRRCIDHEIYDSQDTIAKRVRSERKAVARSLKRLAHLGWITVGSVGPGRSKHLSLNVEKFPAAQPVHKLISENAKKLALAYEKRLRELRCLGRRPKNWWKRQWPSAQNLIDRCDGDAMRAASLIKFAIHHPNLNQRARTSLYHLKAIWPKVVRLCNEMQNQQEPKQANPSTAEEGGNNELQCSEAA